MFFNIKLNILYSRSVKLSGWKKKLAGQVAIITGASSGERITVFLFRL
jgi:hypothetical protein